ncbi:hypothetical protein D7V86_18855 [bacterium D16-51]|nr:hypothetical protein D7V96_05435 [bacterium D16-59]RKI56928.1 hypothetical protein D7V86_18855 [bacterium D16-51]
MGSTIKVFSSLESNYSALRLHSYTAVLSALLMYTFCTKCVQNGTVKLIFLTKSMSKILAFYGRLNCYPGKAAAAPFY